MRADCSFQITPRALQCLLLMEPSPNVGFLDVPVLLEASQPRPRVPWFWLTAGALGVLVFAAMAGSTQAGVMRGVVLVLVFLLFFVFPVMARWALRQLQVDQRAVAGVGESVRLRKWPEAAMGVEQILSRPARSLKLRGEALVYLATILARYHRFEDALSVYEHVLSNDLADPPTAYGIKIARVVAMLREDNLLDADRALTDLKRSGPADSAGYVLASMFRDVKTGHPADAIALFEARRDSLRNQLGHRLGDVWALAAAGYDLLGQSAQAGDAFARATALSPLTELCRRYPEVEKLVGRYAPTPAPPEMA